MSMASASDEITSFLESFEPSPLLASYAKLRAINEPEDDEVVGLDAPHTRTRPSRDPELDERLRVIETQLSATHELVQTLTTLVHATLYSHQPPRGPRTSMLRTSSFAVVAATAVTTSSSSVQEVDDMPHKAPIKPRRTSRSRVSMTRTISTKDIPMLDEEDRVPAPTRSLASAGKIVRRLVHLVSRKTLGLALDPTTAEPSSTGTGDYGVVPTALDRSVRRLTQWTDSLWSKAARVFPVTTPSEVPAATRREVYAPHPFTIGYDATGRVAWDTFVMLLILIDAVMTPLALSFGYFPRLLLLFNLLETVAFTIDFCVQALSSYTTKRGVVVTGPANTIPHYLLSIWALADFLSWFPFEYLGSEGQFLGVAKVVRLVKISQLMRRFHSAKKAGLLRLIRLISIVLLVSHCLACYWNWVATEWRLQEDGYLAMSIAEQYVHCWSIVIGSLNASPPVMYTVVEKISVAVFMLIGNVLQASVFGSVASLIQSFDEDEVAYNKKLINTYERCKLLDIPEPLADRINSFYEHLYRETHSVDPDADSFINELSPALISEVKFQLYRDMVKQIPFFSSAEISPVLIEMLILRLRTVIYMLDDMLIRKGEFGDWMGFIGSKGSVGVLDPKAETHRIVRILRKGDYFGEMGLLHRTKRTTTAVALSWVQVHVLTRGDLDEVKEQYADEAETLEHEIHKYMKSRLTSGGLTTRSVEC